MKKIFLPLLALVGMAGGLVFTSCSSGGDDDKDGPSRAMSGMTIELWPSMTPALEMAFEQPVTANICSVTYTAGTDRPSSGQFTITDSGKEDGGWVVRGLVNIRDNNILNYTGFRGAVGVGDDDIQSISSFIVYFYFNADSDPVIASVFVDGTYGEDGSKYFSKSYPRECNFTVTIGELKTEYLGTDGFDYNTVEPETEKY